MFQMDSLINMVKLSGYLALQQIVYFIWLELSPASLF